MTNALIRELEDRLAGGFTGTITLHCPEGVVNQFEVHERIRMKPEPKSGLVDLSEAGSGRVDSGHG